MMTPPLMPLACPCLLCGAAETILWDCSQLRYVCQACGWIVKARLANIVISPDLFPVLVAGGGTAPARIERRSGSSFTARIALTATGDWQWVAAPTPVVGRCAQCGRAIVHDPIRHCYRCTSRCFWVSDSPGVLSTFLAPPPRQEVIQ